MKRIVSMLLAMCMMLSLCTAIVSADEDIAIGQMQAKDVIVITVDGKNVDCSVYGQMPVIVEGRTLVPLRAVFEALGATVDWNNDTRTVLSQRGDIVISLAVDSTELYVNGEVKTIDVPAQIMNDRTMVPVRAVAEAFGCYVDWDNDTRTALISTSDTPQAVVKKTIDAIMALDIEEASKYVLDSEAFYETIGFSDIEDLMNIEDLNGEMEAFLENLMIELVATMTYTIDDVKTDGDNAVVTATVCYPDLEGVNAAVTLDQATMLVIVNGVLLEHGYKLEDFFSISDAAEMEKLINAIMEATTTYMVDKVNESVASAKKVTYTGEIVLKKIDGKWLVVE